MAVKAVLSPSCLIDAKYRRLAVWNEMCVIAKTVLDSNHLRPFELSNLSTYVTIVADDLYVQFTKHLRMEIPQLASYLCVCYKDMYLSTAEANTLAKEIVNTEERGKKLPKTRSGKSRWYSRSAAQLKRPAVSQQQWRELVQEQRELRAACSDAEALLKWKFTQHVVVRDFLLAQHGRPLNSKAKSHVLTPVFKMQRMHIPISDFC
jgi:hypothetical protein